METPLETWCRCGRIEAPNQSRGGWYLDAGDATRQIRFRGNRCRELLDANMFIGTEKAGILTQLEQWFSPYHIPIYPLSGKSQTVLSNVNRLRRSIVSRM